MDPNEYISISEFCNCYNIEIGFIRSLNEKGLLETVVISEQEFIGKEKIGDLERMMRLHYDLQINLEGIDAINNLLERVSGLQNEIRVLQNRLRRYEE